MEDNNKAVDELINYIHQESSRPLPLPSNNAAVSAHRETMIRHHAIEQLIDAGHLAHEEHPARIAALIAAFARRPEVGLFQDDGRHGMVDSR